jgi:hypothetical protein
MRFVCRIVTLTFFFCLALRMLSATDYDYYPKANISIGGGFRPLNPTTPPPPCLVVSAETLTEDNSVGPFKMDVKLVHDRSQMYELLHWDAHLAARSLAVSGKVDATFDRETSIESEDIVWVLYAYQEFGSKSIDPTLKPRYEALRNTPARLLRTCGPEYVASLRRAAQVAAVFTLHTGSQQTKQTLELHFSGSASFSGGSVDFSAGYKNFLKEASQHGNIEVKVFGFGGGGIAKLSDIVTKSDNFDGVRTTLATYISNEMTADKSFPIGFTTGFFGDLANPPLSESPIGEPPALLSIYGEYGKTLSRIRRIEEILSGRDSAFGFVTDQQVQYLHQNENRLAVNLSSLEHQASTCSSTPSSCAFPNIDVTQIDWPLSPELNCNHWKNGTCEQCQVPVSFVSELTGATNKYSCSKMQNGKTVHVKFENLWITINSNAPDNKVWNAWITASVTGLDNCVLCSDSRVSPGLGAVQNPQLDYNWKQFRFEGDATVQNGASSVQLVLNRCQTGPNLVTCDTSPPGAGSKLGDVPNHGFPDGTPDPPPAPYALFTSAN